MYWMIAIALCFLLPVVGSLMLVAGLIFNIGVILYDYWYTNNQKPCRAERRAGAES